MPKAVINHPTTPFCSSCMEFDFLSDFDVTFPLAIVQSWFDLAVSIEGFDIVSFYFWPGFVLHERWNSVSTTTVPSGLLGDEK
jgi:hypothetical protein